MDTNIKYSSFENKFEVIHRMKSRHILHLTYTRAIGNISEHIITAKHIARFKHNAY